MSELPSAQSSIPDDGNLVFLMSSHIILVDLGEYLVNVFNPSGTRGGGARTINGVLCHFGVSYSTAKQKYPQSSSNS